MRTTVGTFMRTALLLGVVLALGAGCATRRGSIGQPVTAASHEPGQLSADAVAPLLNVKVSTKTETAEADPVADRVKDEIEGNLADAGFTIDETNPDILVGLDIGIELYDQDPPFYLYKGSVDTRVRRAYDSKVLGAKRVSAKGQRVQGEDEALASVATALGDQTASWVVETCAPSQSGVVANDVTVRRAWLSLQDGPKYAQKFIATVEGLDGVLSCRLVREEYDRREAVFRVVYYEKYFPEGLLNRLATLPGLNLEPEN